ncbi:unnamed protein product [Vitrella brassicaformis CCMP3155]|uniref:Uncharacterized protein n=1 Tax=Vitrella brassicaformis (strain CCMP3155) TaxID=1169540 RepID=A0A0G4GKH5_VITBC|nr:unnamed protein product [Vitrella brassicaformis CCMP3155]|eukprot:CEM30496.1 unnamed protein product [Vitrella brassicaformis CCMP3155]
MRKGSREPQLLSQSDTDLLAADLLSADPTTFTAAARQVANACVKERLNKKEKQRLAARLLKDKDGLRRILLRLVNDRYRETQLAAADLLLFIVTENLINPAIAALQSCQLVDVAGVIVDVVTWREPTAASRGYGPDESLYVKHVVKADAAVDVVTYLRLLFLASVLQDLQAAAPREGARLRDSVLANHETTIKQCLKVIRTDTHGSVSPTAYSVVKSLLQPFTTPSPSSPDEDLTPIPLQLSLPLFTLLVEHLGGATYACRGMAVGAGSAFVSLRQKDVRRLLEQHLYPHVEPLLGIVSSAEGGMLAMAAATLGAIMMGVLRLSQQRDFPTHFSLSSCRLLLDNPSLIIKAVKAANALPDQDIELPPCTYSTMLTCLKIPARFAIDSGDIGPGHRWMIKCGHELVTDRKATTNPFVDQIVQCEAVQQLRGRRDLSADVSSFIDSLPKTATVCSSSAATDRSHCPTKRKTAAHTRPASSGAPPPPCSPSPQPSSPVGLDAMVGGLLSDDIETFTAAARGIVGGAVTDASAKRLVVRFEKEGELFLRVLMRLVDDSNRECQLATADLLVVLCTHGFLEHMAPSNRVSAVQRIFEIATWKGLEDLSTEGGGEGGDLGGKVHSIIAHAIVEASSPNEPLLRPIDVVTYVRVHLIRSALEAATALEAAGGPQLRASLLQTPQTTLRQAMEVIRGCRHASLANETVVMLKKLFVPSPVGPSFQLVLEFYSICVESLKQLTDDQTERTSRFLVPLMFAADYLRDSPRLGIVEEWPAIRAALNTHIYAHMDGLVDLIAASDPASPLCCAAIPTSGIFIRIALVLCMRKKTGGSLQLGDFDKYIEQPGAVKILAAAPPPMQPLRSLVLDATLRDRVANTLDMDYRAHEDPRNSLACCITTALVIPAMALIDGGEAGILIESQFVSSLTLIFERAERIDMQLLVLCMTCVKTLSQRDRKVSKGGCWGLTGLAQAICDMLLKDAQGQLLLGSVFDDCDRATAVEILKGIVSYGKSQVAKGTPNPIVGEIVQFESAKAIRKRTSGIEVSQQVFGFFNSLAQQHQNATKAKPETTISAAQLAAQEAKAKRMQDALLAEERHEKEAKEKEDQKANQGKSKGTKGKGKGKKNKGGKEQQAAAGGDEAGPSDALIEPSVPSTAASTSRVSAAEEVEASQSEPSSSIADTSGVPFVSSVSAAARSDRPGDGGDAAKSAAGGSEADGSDDEDGDAMLLNSAFGRHARQQLSEGKKKAQAKHTTKPTPTPTSQPSQPSRPSLPPALKTNQTGRPAPAASDDRYRGGNAPIRMPAAIPLSSAQFPKGRFKMSPGNGGMAPPLPKRPSPLLSDDDSPSGSASPLPRPVGGRGAGRGLMTMFAHHPPRPPSIPLPRLPSAEELRNGPSLQRPTGQDDQQQPTRGERPSLSTAGPQMSRFFAHAPVGPAPPAAAADGGGLWADPFYDEADMYLPPPPAYPPPPPPHPSDFHPMGPPLPVSYNGGPQASGVPSHPFGNRQPFPYSPTPAAAAAAAAAAASYGGGGLSADQFHDDDSGGDDMYVPPPPPIFEYEEEEEEEEGYQPPSSSSAADPFAAVQMAGAMQGGNGGPSTGFGAVTGAAAASDSEQLVDQLCRQLEQTQQEAKQKDQEAKRRAREARRRAREVQEARQKEQEAKRNEEAMIRRLQEAEWTIAKMTAQQSSHYHHQPSSSSSSSAPPPPSTSFAQPHPSTHASTTQQQQHGGEDDPACVICFGEYGPVAVMYIPCRHMHICTKCYADRRRTWQQNIPRVMAENARRVEANRELIKNDKEPMAILPEGYLCEQCQTEVAFAGSVTEVAQWSTSPFVTGAS